MKVKNILIMSLLLLDMLSAQPFGFAVKGYRIDKIAYRNASGEIATTYFFYDGNEPFKKTFWTLDNDQRWSLNDYVYDRRGNLRSAFRGFSDSLFSYESFDYDRHGNKIKEYFNRSDGINGSATYIYKKNRLVEAHYNRHKGWLNGTVRYIYENGKRVRGDLIIRGEHRCTITYTYDEVGNLIHEHWDFNGQWEQTFDYIYKRDDMKKRYYTSPYFADLDANRISRETYRFNDSVGGPSYYHYDSRDQLDEKIFERSDGFKTVTRFTYGKNGQLESSLRHYPDGSEGRFSYTYDPKNRLIDRELFKDDTLSAVESHAYDEDGRLIKSYFRNVDGWLNGTIDYGYDLRGRLTEGIFHGENGYDAKLVFTRDPEDLLIKLTWYFSTGDVQEYTFKYEKAE